MSGRIISMLARIPITQRPSIPRSDDDLADEDKHMINHDLEVLSQIVKERMNEVVMADGEVIKAENKLAQAQQDQEAAKAALNEAVAAFHKERRERGIPDD